MGEDASAVHSGRVASSKSSTAKAAPKASRTPSPQFIQDPPQVERFPPPPSEEPAGLRPEEEEWADRFNRLQERFPDASPAAVLQALRESNGRAGKAAMKLRDGE